MEELVDVMKDIRELLYDIRDKLEKIQGQGDGHYPYYDNKYSLSEIYVLLDRAYKNNLL